MNLGDINTSLKSIQQSLSAIGTALKSFFPQGGAITATSSGSSGKFMTVTGQDGNTYKIPLNNP